MKHAEMQDLAALKRQLEKQEKKSAKRAKLAQVSVKADLTPAKELAERITLLVQSAQQANHVALKTNRLALERWIDQNIPQGERAQAKHRVKQVLDLELAHAV